MKARRLTTLRSVARRRGIGHGRRLLWNRARNVRKCRSIVNYLLAASEDYARIKFDLSHQNIKAAVAASRNKRVFNSLARLLELSEVANDSNRILVDIGAATDSGKLIAQSLQKFGP